MNIGLFISSTLLLNYFVNSYLVVTFLESKTGKDHVISLFLGVFLFLFHTETKEKQRHHRGKTRERETRDIMMPDYSQVPATPRER